MSKVATTFHNGSKVSREHNIRDEKVCKGQKHIDLEREHEIWKDEAPKDAYERLFGEAVKEFNAKQRNEDRKIKDYYKKVANTNDKHSAKPVYEVVVSVGNYKHPIDEQESKDILKCFVDGWSERNPNLEMIGAYYHNDEEGVPHVHIDYIPVAHKDRGLKVKNSLSGALQEMGYEDGGVKNTRQMQWEESEKKALESLVQERGYETIRSKEAKRQWLEKEEYQARERKKDLEDVSNQLKGRITEQRTEKEELEKACDVLQQDIADRTKQNEALKQENKELTEQKSALQQGIKELSEQHFQWVETRERDREEQNKAVKQANESAKKIEQYLQRADERIKQRTENGYQVGELDYMDYKDLMKSAKAERDELEKTTNKLKTREHETEEIEL